MTFTILYMIVFVWIWVVSVFSFVIYYVVSVLSFVIYYIIAHLIMMCTTAMLFAPVFTNMTTLRVQEADLNTTAPCAPKKKTRLLTQSFAGTVVCELLLLSLASECCVYGYLV